MEIGRVGIWTFLDAPPPQQIGDIAAELEALGYGAIWVPEALGRDPFLLAALILAGSERITAATGIASIYAREANAMSCGWKTLGEAFPGRFLLGLGVSHAPMVEGIRGQKYRSPIATMRAYLDAMDTANYTATTPDPLPGRVLAALGPRMLELSAERTDGAHPYNVPPEHTSVAREALGVGPLLAPAQAVVLETDPEAARRVARDSAARSLSLPNYANNLLRLGYTESDVTHVSDRVIDAVVAWGDVDAIRARVQAHLDAGADHVCVHVIPRERGALPLAEWRELAPALVTA